MFHLAQSFGSMAKLVNGSVKNAGHGSKALNFCQSLTFLKVPELEKEENLEAAWSPMGCPGSTTKEKSPSL